MTKPLSEIAESLAVKMADLYDIMIDLNRIIETTEPEENGITPAGASEIAAVCKMLSDAYKDWERHSNGFMIACGIYPGRDGFAE